MIVEDFFRERVDAVMERRKRPVSPEAEGYLVDMLSGFVWNGLDWEALGFRLYGSLGPDRVLVLKEVGDSSLFLLGFFAEFVRRRPVSPAYYVQIGQSAYGELGSRFGGVYPELARRFPEVREALREVRATMTNGTMDAYKEWLRSRSGASELVLRRVGLLVDKG
jgi:hypothetical protein